MVFNDPVRDGQAETGTPGFRCKERVEYFAQMFLLDTPAGIGDFYFTPQGIIISMREGSRLHRQHTALRHCLAGIDQEIPEHLSQALGIPFQLNMGSDIARDPDRIGKIPAVLQ
jgi:hypothetical protein